MGGSSIAGLQWFEAHPYQSEQCQWVEVHSRCTGSASGTPVQARTSAARVTGVEHADR